MRHFGSAVAKTAAVTCWLCIAPIAIAQQGDDAAALNAQAIKLQKAGNYVEAIPLAERVLALREKGLGPDHSDVGSALYNLATLYQNQGRYAEAEPLFNRALAIKEKVRGPDHPEVALVLNNMGLLYRDEGRYREAEPLYQRALKIQEKAQGADNPATATPLNNLADVYQHEGRYADAESLYRRALAIHEKAQGPDHPDVAVALSNLAALYGTQGRYADAIPLSRRSLAIREKAFGPDHPDVAVSLNNLAALYGAQGHFAEAEPLYRRDLAIVEKAFGPEHPNVATALQNLAQLYDNEDRQSEAEPLFKRCLEIREKALGPNHPDVANALEGLASLHRELGRYREAEPLYKRALEIREKVFGPAHPDVAIVLERMARLYLDEGRYRDAEPVYKRALEILEKSKGGDHPEVATVLHDLALLYSSEGRYQDAEPLYKRALEIEEKALGPDHPGVSTMLTSLAAVYRAQGRYDEAEPLMTRGLAIDEKVLGPDDPQVASALDQLALLHYRQDRHNEAEPLYKRALAIQEHVLSPDHPDLAASLNLLGMLYLSDARYAEAEALLERSLAIREKSLGLDHPDVAVALNNLAQLYFVQKDWHRAADYWRRSTQIVLRRTARNAGAGTQVGDEKSEAERVNYQFQGLVKAVSRLAEAEPAHDPALAAEMFETAQSAQSSEAAKSLAQMAVRSAAGKPELARLVRERQDLVAEWQKRDKSRSAAVAQAPGKRDKDAEVANTARLTEIDAHIAEIDRRLAQDFPDYDALVSPNPVSIADARSELRDNEALVLFLDTPEWGEMPEETFIWVLTRTDSRWVKSSLGPQSIRDRVAALRCGLDYDGSWAAPGSRCAELLKAAYTEADHASDKPLPFDINRAHELYAALFGQVENLIKGKQLLLVPSGALTSLPFQVLVTSLPPGPPAGDVVREVGLLGAEMSELTDSQRKGLHLADKRGVGILRTVAGGAAEAAGLSPSDILLSVDGHDVGSVQQSVAAVRAHAAHAPVALRVLRNGAEIDVSATLGATKVHDWIPHFLDPTTNYVSWLIRDHALTVLPSVSSLKALRALAKDSHASRRLIGFGDPLLDGQPDAYPQDAALALRARASQSCGLTQQVASLSGEQRGLRRLNVRAGTADLVQLRMQVPLPETADELCAVARDLRLTDDDIRLGMRATEAEVKRLSEAGELAKYRVVHFATHGALAGQVSGDAEPGLLLTPPDEATETDDGYLSASEIAALKLDADWVILSACNTAAGGAEGAEALSGLARAFFYAGARSLLVSHWSVYSDATVKLITGAIGTMAAKSEVGRAEAMRRSMLALIDRGNPYEAHPAFWAPFVVVGEGAVRLQ